MKRTLTALLALSALTLSAAMTFSSCSHAEETEEAPVSAPDILPPLTVSSGNKTPETDRPAYTGKMKPGGKVITVAEESFHGFDDLTSVIDGVTITHESKETVAELVKCGAIAQKINPNDESGKFYPDQTMTAAEAITLVVNAFSDEKIPLEDWYSYIYARINEDDFPVNFTNYIFDSKKDNLSHSIRVDEFCTLLLFAFEKYTGITLEPSHNLDKITNAEAHRILYDNGIMNLPLSSEQTSLLIVRYRAAEAIGSLLKYKEA